MPKKEVLPTRRTCLNCKRICRRDSPYCSDECEADHEAIVLSQSKSAEIPAGVEDRPVLAHDEFAIWQEAFVAQIRARARVVFAFDYAEEALEAYQAVREDSYLVKPCECPHCVAARAQKPETVN